MPDARDARPDEHEAIYRLGFDAWGEGDLETYLAGCRASPKYARGRWLVLDAPGAPRCALITYALGPGVAGIGSVATAPEARRQGLASRLLGAALARLEAEGTHTAFLWADAAPGLYRAHGFVPLPERFQGRPGSTCMVRAADPDALWAAPGFAPPRYF